MTETIKKTAPKILAAIKASNNILLHCHPSPDPDSVGSALAMKFALEGMGKKATVIRGDSEIPQAFMHFPGADTIVPKNFFEVDLKEFDLFIVQDTGDLGRVSKKGQVVVPDSLRTIAIDHHDSTLQFGNTENLIDPSYASTTAILFDLFKLWKLKITPEMAANLFIGIYTDTGGFKYSKTTSETLEIAAELTKIYSDFSKLLLTMENGRNPKELTSLGLLLSDIKTYLNGHLAVALLSNETLVTHGLDAENVSTGWASSLLRSVIGWDISACSVEVIPGTVITSFRSRDENKFDLSKLAAALGGGGHKAAAGATLTMPLSQAIEKIVATVKEIYNL